MLSLASNYSLPQNIKLCITIDCIDADLHLNHDCQHSKSVLIFGGFVETMIFCVVVDHVHFGRIPTFRNSDKIKTHSIPSFCMMKDSI